MDGWMDAVPLGSCCGKYNTEINKKDGNETSEYRIIERMYSLFSSRASHEHSFTVVLYTVVLL